MNPASNPGTPAFALLREAWAFLVATESLETNGFGSHVLPVDAARGSLLHIGKLLGRFSRSACALGEAA